MQYNLSPDGEHLDLNSWAGFPKKYYRLLKRLELGQAVCGWVAQNRQPMIVNHIQSSTDRRTMLVRTLGIDTYACHPLIANGKLLGTLSFGSKRLSQFDEQTIYLLHTFCQMVATALERKQAQDELARSEENYRLLFESIDEGFCLIEILFDEQGRPCDYRFLETNPAFVSQTGLENAVGKRVREIVPGQEQYWFDIYGQVALKGEPVRFINEARHLDRWFDVFAFRVGDASSRQVAVLFNDITERKRNEVIIQAAAERNAYLVELADWLRGLDDAAQVKTTAMRLLGERLNASRVVYVDVDQANNRWQVDQDYRAEGIGSLVGEHSFTDFGDYFFKTMLTGQPLVIEDCQRIPGLSEAERASYKAIQCDAYIAVPLIKGGRFAAYLAVNQDQPRAWTSEEVLLTMETAERTWSAVERVLAEAALRKSEERFRTSIENLNEAFLILSSVRDPAGQIVDFRYDYVNEATLHITGLQPEQMIGHSMLEVLPYHEPSGLFGKYAHVVESGEPLLEQSFVFNEEAELTRQVKGVFFFHAVKFGDGLIITSDDITEQVRLEREHREARTQMEIHRRLSEQREKERQSIARDIHDGPIQTLSSLGFNMQYIKERFNDPQLKVELNEVSLSLKAVIQELRQVMYELRPPSVIRFGLAKAIQVHTDNLREHYPHIAWTLDLADQGRPLEDQITLTLFRIYQEAVLNVVRHSGATQGWVRFTLTDHEIEMEIRDNGQGFDPHQDLTALIDQQHFGLAGMAERVESIGGSLVIRAKPGEGVTIHLRVPNP